MITALGTVAIASLTPQPNGTTSVALAPPLLWGLIVAAIVTLILLAIQWRFEYRKRTYDPTWALKFDDLFVSNQMRERRSRAAVVLKTKASQSRDPTFRSKEIDEILDFFEDLGFYMRGDQITPEVTHHAFFYWIDGYYSATRDYIEMSQHASPTHWEFVSELFETTFEVEMKRSKGKCKRFLDANELSIFLDEEGALVPKKGC